MRSAVAELSTKNLLHNLNVIKQTAPDCKIIAMVKANAYGHGLRSISLRLEPEVNYLGVAAIDEAIQLRAAGIRLPIVLMEGAFELEEIIISAKKNFPMVIHNEEQLTWLKQLGTLPDQLSVWLKIDTGMGRLGFRLDEASSVYDYLASNKNLHLLGLMSHLACADYSEHPNNRLQLDNFDRLVKKLQKTRKLAGNSLCNSAAIFNFKDWHYHVVRPGLALYGISPLAGNTAADLGLLPVMTLKTKVIAIKKLDKGATVGYGARFVCTRPTKAAVIAIGYGDGYPRSAVDGAPTLISGERVPLIGKVSMDMAVVDISDCKKQVECGSEVILWGDGLPIEELSSYTGNGTYDLLTAIQYRVRFIWS